MDEMFSFAKPFKVYVDGTELENVSALQLTRNCEMSETDADKNACTVYYSVGNSKRVMTVDLGVIHFGKS